MSSLYYLFLITVTVRMSTNIVWMIVIYESADMFDCSLGEASKDAGEVVVQHAIRLCAEQFRQVTHSFEIVP